MDRMSTGFGDALTDRDYTVKMALVAAALEQIFERVCQDAVLMRVHYEICKIDHEGEPLGGTMLEEDAPYPLESMDNSFYGNMQEEEDIDGRTEEDSELEFFVQRALAYHVLSDDGTLRKMTSLIDYALYSKPLSVVDENIERALLAFQRYLSLGTSSVEGLLAQFRSYMRSSVQGQLEQMIDTISVAEDMEYAIEEDILECLCPTCQRVLYHDVSLDMSPLQEWSLAVLHDAGLEI